MRSITFAIAFAFVCLLPTVQATAAGGIEISGSVTGSGRPIAGSAVTLWAATGPGAPVRVAQSTTAENGTFFLRAGQVPDDALVFYAVANGGRSTESSNPAISLMSILGSRPPVAYYD